VSFNLSSARKYQRRLEDNFRITATGRRYPNILARKHGILDWDRECRVTCVRFDSLRRLRYGWKSQQFGCLRRTAHGRGE
jgi:hypothetical protein